MSDDSRAYPADEQRRRFSRTRFQAPARLETGGRTHACDVLDLSLKGALLRIDGVDDLRTAAPCSLDLLLDDESARILMRGEIAHIEGDRIGLSWHEIDLDSMTHLRNLLMLNLGEPALLDRELSVLLQH